MQIDHKKLQLLMARRCVVRKKLAEMAGVTPLTISMVISGRNARPSTVGLIAKALCVDPSEIIKEEQQCPE